VPEKSIVYEQPLNERVRAMLRLEYLFERAAYRIDGSTVWDSRATLDALMDILALLTRSDLRQEIIKELERHGGVLDALRNRSGVDLRRLKQVLEQVRELIGSLKSTEAAPGHDLRQDELLANVRQRSAIPAGTCSFDVPAFQYWLERPPEVRVQQLKRWLSEFDLIRDSVSLSLQLIRDSANASQELAPGGFFQRSIDPGLSCQMVRVVIPADAPWFPEISGGRHRFTVRFMRQAGTEYRPVQANEDVAFELHCCIL
jgi:cell division protein ZapD